jgi:hypothetical protein
MPQYRFHTAVAGVLDAPSADAALTMLHEFVQAGNSLPAQIEFLDAEVHEAVRYDSLQRLDDTSAQLRLFGPQEVITT